MVVMVDTLQNLVIFELVRRKYKESNLSGIISKTVFVYRKNDERFPVSKYEQKFFQARDTICENWVIPGNLTYLKKRIFLCFKAIVLEILQYGKDMAQSLKQFDFHVKFCIERICLTQRGRIDKAKTILTILKDSKFLVKFFYEFLFHNMVMNKDIISASEKVLKSIKNSTDCDKVARIEAAITDTVRLYFMDMAFIAREYATDGTTSNVRAAFFSLFRNKNYEGLRKLCDLMDLDCRRKFLGDRYTKRWFALKMSRLDGEMIQYLFYNLTSEEWKELLKISFNNYFRFLIYDWRYAGFAVTIFEYAVEADIIDINNMVFIFSLGHNMNIENDDVELADQHGTLCWIDIDMADTCINILKEIWHKTPIELRNELKDHILQSEDIRHINPESLMSIIDNCSVDDQGRFISKIMNDINKREFSDYKTADYNKLYNMYLCLMSKSNNQIVVNDDIITKFRSFCDI